MTLLEAIASGKHFRLRGSGQAFIDPNFQKLELTKSQIQSGDWEVAKEMVMVDKVEYEQMKAARAK